MQSIMKMGVILPPCEVKDKISKGKLDENVLGFSYKDRNASYFPDYVSMVGNVNHIQGMAELICQSRNNGYSDPNFIAYAFEIDPNIQNQSQFVPYEKVQSMNPCSISLEVLYKGRISKEFFANEWPMPVRLKSKRDIFEEIKFDPFYSNQEPSVEELVARTFEQFRNMR